MEGKLAEVSVLYSSFGRKSDCALDQIEIYYC